LGEIGSSVLRRHPDRGDIWIHAFQSLSRDSTRSSLKRYAVIAEVEIQFQSLSRDSTRSSLDNGTVNRYVAT